METINECDGNDNFDDNTSKPRTLKTWTRTIKEEERVVTVMVLITPMTEQAEHSLNTS